MLKELKNVMDFNDNISFMAEVTTFNSILWFYFKKKKKETRYVKVYKLTVKHSRKLEACNQEVCMNEHFKLSLFTSIFFFCRLISRSSL